MGPTQEPIKSTLLVTLFYCQMKTQPKLVSVFQFCTITPKLQICTPWGKKHLSCKIKIVSPSSVTHSQLKTKEALGTFGWTLEQSWSHLHEFVASAALQKHMRPTNGDAKEGNNTDTQCFLFPPYAASRSLILGNNCIDRLTPGWAEIRGRRRGSETQVRLIGVIIKGGKVGRQVNTWIARGRTRRSN